MKAVARPSEILTVKDVAIVLRCSKAHVSNIIRGKVPHLPPLPNVRIGRRVLIRDESLIEWMRAVEAQTAGVR
ncbi:MAG: helix-turn-helix domain-containing protein [Acidobacteria bacterium]|nr:helix-turn-helix domain-containing protein [Acidobacteriota bacterium]